MKIDKLQIIQAEVSQHQVNITQLQNANVKNPKAWK